MSSPATKRGWPKGVPRGARRAFLLSCYHTVVYEKPWPEVGTEVYCLKCRGAVLVAERPNADYRIRCYGCRYGATFGSNAVLAMQAAGKHHSKHPHHHTVVYNNGIVHHSYEPNPGTMLPGLDPDEPPF